MLLWEISIDSFPDTVLKGEREEGGMWTKLLELFRVCFHWTLILQGRTLRREESPGKSRAWKDMKMFQSVDSSRER